MTGSTIIAPRADPDVERRAIRALRRRLVPLLGLMVFVGMLDRTNIGVAALTMQADLGLSATLFSLGATMFTIGYCVFEIPSNLILYRIGARIWFTRIMISWGLVTMLTAFVWNASSFLTMRLLLGLAEAGLMPGILLFISRWFPRKHRASGMAGVLIAQPIANMLGNPISGVLLTRDELGLAGWQWVFIVEGALAVILVFIPLWLLADHPRDAGWLKPDERAWLQDEIDGEARLDLMSDHTTMRRLLADRRILIFILAAVCVAAAIHSLGFWLPTTIKGLSGSDDFKAALLSSIPYAGGCVMMLLLARRAARVRRLELLVAGTMLGIATALVALPFTSGASALAVLTLAVVLVTGCSPIFWTLVSSTLSGRAAAGGLALVSMIGNIGTGLGPVIIGWARDHLGNFLWGYVVVAALLVIAALLLAGIDGRASHRTPALAE